MKSFFSILFFGISLLAFSQEPEQDSTKRDWKPTHLMIGVDVFQPLASFSSGFAGYELTASIDFFRNLYLRGDFGQRKRTRIDNYEYISSGNYFRIGLMNNLLKSSPEKNVLALGFNYALANFDNTLNYTKSNLFYENVENLLEDEGVRAWWFELTASLNVKVWKQMYLGYSVRYKFLKNVRNEDGIETYDIPGYGRNKKSGTQFKNTNFGMNYYLIWRFNFKEESTKKPNLEE